MPIEKLEEFARDGQKNTDELILTDGFPRPKFPARQWFNYLFNMLSLKINEIIDLDPVARSEIVDNLTTNDSNKPVSAKQAKILQDTKVNKNDIGSNPNQIPSMGNFGLLDRGYGYISRSIPSSSDLASQSYVTGWHSLAGTYDNAPVATTITGQMLVSVRHYGAGAALVFLVWNGVGADFWVGSCNYSNNEDKSVTPSGAINWKRVAYTDSNVASATKLSTARKFTYTGAATGSVDFDGSGNVSCALTLSNFDASKITSGTINAARIPTLNQSTTGNAATATKLANTRTIGGVSFDGTANINLPGVNAMGNQNTSGNAGSATKLATARKINNVAFDGTKDIKIQGDGSLRVVKGSNYTISYDDFTRRAIIEITVFEKKRFIDVSKQYGSEVRAFEVSLPIQLKKRITTEIYLTEDISLNISIGQEAGEWDVRALPSSYQPYTKDSAGNYIVGTNRDAALGESKLMFINRRLYGSENEPINCIVKVEGIF